MDQKNGKNHGFRPKTLDKSMEKQWFPVNFMEKKHGVPLKKTSPMKPTKRLSEAKWHSPFFGFRSFRPVPWTASAPSRFLGEPREMASHTWIFNLGK